MELRRRSVHILCKTVIKAIAPEETKDNLVRITKTPHGLFDMDDMINWGGKDDGRKPGYTSSHII